MGLFVLFVSKHFLIKGKASLFGPNVHKDPAVEFCEDTSSLKTYASKKVLYESGVVIMARTSQRYINDFHVAGRADVEIKTDALYKHSDKVGSRDQSGSLAIIH